MNMTAPAVLLALHWVSGFIVLAYGLHRLEHIAPFKPGIDRRKRAEVLIEATAWVVLTIGAGGAVITPFLPLERPTLQDACVLAGMATFLIARHIRGVRHVKAEDCI